MTSDEIEALILRDRWVRNTCVPNYTPVNWWECDVWERTTAGYFREYEIKTSRADFLKDAAKGRTLYLKWKEDDELRRRQSAARAAGQPIPEAPAENKHALLAQHSTRGPVQFWFVAPAGVLKLSDIPEWAGLIEVVEVPNGGWGNRLREQEAKTAPRLHNEKMSEKISHHAVGVCYYRFQHLLGQHTRLQTEARKHIRLLRAFGWPKVKPSNSAQKPEPIKT